MVIGLRRSTGQTVGGSGSSSRENWRLLWVL
jgi:hypothetical protein